MATRAHTHTRAHTRTRAHTHTHIHTRANIHTRTYTHAHIHTRAHTHTRTHTRAHARALRTLSQHAFNKHTHTHTHARTHTRAHTHTHSRIHIRTHTHTHTHTAEKGKQVENLASIQMMRILLWVCLTHTHTVSLRNVFYTQIRRLPEAGNEKGSKLRLSSFKCAVC